MEKVFISSGSYPEDRGLDSRFRSHLPIRGTKEKQLPCPDFYHHCRVVIDPLWGDSPIGEGRRL